MPAGVARRVLALVPKKMAELPSQLRTLQAAGWQVDDLEAEVLKACVQRYTFPRSRWDPERGALEVWVYVVARSTLNHKLQQIRRRAGRVELVGGSMDVALTSTGHPGDVWDALQAGRTLRNPSTGAVVHQEGAQGGPRGRGRGGKGGRGQCDPVGPTPGVPSSPVPHTRNADFSETVRVCASDGDHDDGVTTT